MHGDLRRRQPEDQPPAADIHVRQLEDIAQDRAIRVGVGAVDNRMRAGNHDNSRHNATRIPAAPGTEILLRLRRDVDRRWQLTSVSALGAQRHNWGALLHTEHERVPGLLPQHLQRSQLHQRRTSFDKRRRVREVAERRGFASRFLQRGKPFLTSLHDLREDLLQLAGKSQVAQRRIQQLDADGFEPRSGDRLQLRGDLRRAGAADRRSAARTQSREAPAGAHCGLRRDNCRWPARRVPGLSLETSRRCSPSPRRRPH